MSDLALPPLTLVAPDGHIPAEHAGGTTPALDWPAPPAGKYRNAEVPPGGIASELEGLNGRVMRVLLARLDLKQGLVEVLSPGLRAPMQLRFGQFRRLALTPLLEPAAPIPSQGILSYRLRSRTSTDRNGLTVGHVETASGVFLFEPQDSRGAVRRVFIPATAYESLAIGNTLLQGSPGTAARLSTAAATGPAPAAPAPATPGARPTAPGGAGDRPRAAAPRATQPAPLAARNAPEAPAARAPHAATAAGPAAPPRPVVQAPIAHPPRAASPPAPPDARPGSAAAPVPPGAAPTDARAALPVLPELGTDGPSKGGLRPRSDAGGGANAPAAHAPSPAKAAGRGELPPLTLDFDFPTLDKPAAAPAAPPPAPMPKPAVVARTAAPAPATAPAGGGAGSAGAVLRSKPVTTAEELLVAVERQAKMPMLRMGEALIALGYISTQQLEQALTKQQADRSVPLGEILVRSGAIRRDDLQQAMVRKMGYPVVDTEEFTPDSEALVKVSYSLASRLEVLPLLLRGGRLYVAMEDPTRSKSIDEIEFASGCKLVPVLAPQGRIASAIDACYQKMGAATAGLRGGSTLEFEGESPDAAELLASLESEGSNHAGSDDDRSIEQSDNSLVRLINQMIIEAHSMGVSDIHVESQPGREKVRIRFRRDGVLRPYMELPHTYRNALIARLKIMCDLDISEKRKPQDGKIAFGKFHPGSRLELRVATIPTTGGLEDAVMRLLASAKPLPLDEIGLSARNLPLIKAIVDRPYGMFLCVGPTGSGKTTTLHSALGYINKPDRKIWTAEDPIEITQSGLRQVQVNPKIELTFARALRAFLRADPDVIMVGEIRDKETASVAIESSLTGHLVLSTLHTNSAPETVTRLLDMGMDPFNFADALLGVLAQRLVRRVCSGCRSSREATPAETEELLADYLNAFGHPETRPSEDEVLASWRARFGLDGRLHHYHGSGCDKCGGTGLRGRAGVHELMTVSREVRRLIQTGARVDELQKAAIAEGMLTLRQDGIEKVLQGVTTLGEVRATTN